MGVLIDAAVASDVRGILAGNSASGVRALEGLNRPGITLPAVLDLALFRSSTAFKAQQKNWPQVLRFPILDKAEELLRSTARFVSPSPFSTQLIEIFPIRTFEDVASDEWTLFRARFERAAAGGKKGKVFVGVAAAFSEMADNIVSHAYRARNQPCRGLAAYHVDDDTVCFTVADDGQGFHASLRQTEKWKDLTSEKEALEAVLFKHATSRANEAEGGGFRTLFNKLVSFNGEVSVRSGSCHSTLNSGTGFLNSAVFAEKNHVPGAQVSVLIGKRGKPSERSLSDNNS